MSIGPRAERREVVAGGEYQRGKNNNDAGEGGAGRGLLLLGRCEQSNVTGGNDERARDDCPTNHP